MKILLTILSVLFLFSLISCAGRKLEVSEGVTLAQLEEQDRLIAEIEAKMCSFDVLQKIGIPDKVISDYNNNVMQTYWFYENEYPFPYSFVIYFEDDISQNFTQVKSIGISITGEVDRP